MGISFKWNRPQNEIINEKIGGDKIQLYLANEARKAMAPYVPETYGSGAHMVANVRTYVEDGKGIVHYLSPYARFQYHGKLMLSSITGSAWSRGESKVLTDKPLHYSKGTATSHWDRAMLVAHKADLTGAVQKFINQGH